MVTHQSQPQDKIDKKGMGQFTYFGTMDPRRLVFMYATFPLISIGKYREIIVLYSMFFMYQPNIDEVH